jgi:tRNA A-37 threonylcarbamoyl transferase component Bud32
VTEAEPTRDDAALASLLAQALAARADGGEPDLAQLCGERGDLVPELRSALAMHGALPALHARALAAEPEALGRLLAGRYELRAELGRGAAGTVYLARDTELGRDVAIKLLTAGAFASETGKARFLREAEVLARLEHPHVVRIYDRGTTDTGGLFLVTELLRGHSLQRILQEAQAAMPRGPDATAFRTAPWLAELLPGAHLEDHYLRQVVRWTAELGDGLAAAHAIAVLHRDVKPSNAFVRSDGSVVLLDFGIAAHAGDARTTLDGAVLGTPSYMAPEQAAGAPPGPALDVYGLGALLYHLLTLRPPHRGSLPEVLVAVRQHTPVPARALHPGLPRDLQAILDHTLAERPRDRRPARVPRPPPGRGAPAVAAGARPARDAPPAGAHGRGRGRRRGGAAARAGAADAARAGDRRRGTRVRRGARTAAG